MSEAPVEPGTPDPMPAEPVVEPAEEGTDDDEQDQDNGDGDEPES